MKDIQILCTIGPSSVNQRTIEQLDSLGVSVFRINLSHTNLEDLEGLILKIKQYTTKPICLDTEGAQIRNRYVENGRIRLQENAYVKLTGEDIVGNEKRISLTPDFVVEKIAVGSLVSVDFNSVLLQVVERKEREIVAKVISGGDVGNNKAVTIDHYVELPVMSKKDVEAVSIGKKYGLTYFALSFASSKNAVEQLRKMTGNEAFIISKVESRIGVQNLDDIINVSNAILIDRGDLSREVSLEKIPFMQKLIIEKCNEKGKPVYVATNLLESMIRDKKPTRAEANDVINTLIDGADGLVLAAETAVGKYPADCVAMVASFIDLYRNNARNFSFEGLLNRDSHFLVEPHGGNLIDGVCRDIDEKYIKSLPKLVVDRTVIMDAEQIALGTFSPVNGFMDSNELKSVLSTYRLPSGVVWPLPILLQVSKSEAETIKINKEIALCLNVDGDIYAIINVKDVYECDLDALAKELYCTTDDYHPGIGRLKLKDGCFIGGKVTLIKRLEDPYKQYELTPRQVRAIFENKGWRRVVGFHTRNVIHKAHEVLQLRALENYGCSGLFVHPIVGPKKKDDYSAHAIIKSYEMMMDNHYPKGKVFLATFSTFSRYAGPREAVFTALCRKNFGCSHFIVGRDHTGVGSYYKPEDSKVLFKALGNMGITPIFFENVYYCEMCGQHVEKCKHGTNAANHISGSQAREILKSGKQPPKWFMREDISKHILDEIAGGRGVFVG